MTVTKENPKIKAQYRKALELKVLIRDLTEYASFLNKEDYGVWPPYDVSGSIAAKSRELCEKAEELHSQIYGQ